MNNNDVVEIDLIMIIKKLLLQWKAILIVAVVFGIVGMNVQYAKAVSEAKLAEQEVDIESLLTDDEIDTVETAVALNQKISDLKSYISKSLLMAVDPLDYEQVSMVVTIHATAGTDSRDIASLYVKEVQSNDFVDQIIQGMNKNTTASYVANLMTVFHEKDDSDVDVSLANTDQVNISVIVPKGWDGEKLAELVQSAADKIDLANYENRYTASIDYIAVNRDSSFELQQKQKAITDSVSALKSQLTTAESAFTENQNKLYEEMIVVESEEDVEGTEATVLPQRSNKYFVLSAVIGILAYVCVYVGVIMFGKLASSELVDSTGVLATIYVPRKKNNLLGCLFDDKYLRKILFKKELDFDSQMNLLAQNIEMTMINKESKDVLIAGSRRALELIKGALDSKVDSVTLRYVVVETSDDINVLVKDIKRMDSLMIAIEDRITKKEDVVKLQKVALIGTIQNIGQVVIL